MSVKRKKAEQIFGGLENGFNLHLLKLMGFTVCDETRDHWKKELRGRATMLSIITLNDDNRPVPAKDVFNWLYDETFGGRELQNVEALLRLLSEDHQRSATPAADISARLRAFHQALAQRINRHDPGYDLINAL